jgi:hypothetical protein
MSGVQMVLAAGGVGLIAGNWDDINTTAGGTNNNVNVTPTGYGGTRTLTLTKGTFALGGVTRYRINSGAYTAFTSATDISITAGDTVNFQYTSGGSLEAGQITVTDKSRGVVIDTITCSSTT